MLDLGRIMMLRGAHDIFMFFLFVFFRVSFFLSLFCLSAFLCLKSRPIFYKETIEPLSVLSSSISRTQERGLFYSEIQETRVSLEDLREEMDIFRFILRFSDEITPSDSLRLAKLIKEECENYGLDPFLILAVIQVESKFSPKAVSPKGAIGLMQVMPETAEFIAGELGVSIDERKSLYNPFINVRLGIYYLSFLINRFKSVDRALFAYNVGPSFLTAGSLEKRLPAYVRKVLSFKSRLEIERIAAEQS